MSVSTIWRAHCFVLGLVLSGASLHAQQQSPDPPPPPPILPTLSPPLPPPWIVVTRPDPLPSPPDLRIPDAAGLRSMPDPSQSRLKRALNRATPRCLDAVIHNCWSAPPADESAAGSHADREFANDIAVGNMYFKEKNYRGAEFRFHDALAQKPNDEEATFKLAQSLDKQHKAEEAKNTYQKSIETGGTYTDSARKVLDRLNESSAGK